MAFSRHTFRLALPALLCGAFSIAAGPFVGAVHAAEANTAGTSAAGIAGVFDAGWSTAYYPQDSITHMHQRLHALGMDEVVLQYAAVEALGSCDGEVDRMREEYDDRRRIIVNGFNKLGLACREPMGAFYAFPSIRSTGLTSDEFCERLLYEKRVAVVPGNAFGASGEGYIRASYCYSIDHIHEALVRIGAFLGDLRREGRGKD